MNRSAVPSVAALAAGALLLGGCTLGTAEEAPATDAAPAPSSGSGTAEGVGGTVEVLLASAGQETVDLSGELPVVATRAAESGEGAYEVDLNGVVVRDGLMTVVFTLRVESVASTVFSVNSMFDDGRSVDGTGVIDPSAYSTDGVYVLDPAEATRHLTAYDSEDRCVCADGLSSGGGLQEGGTVVLSSTMAAPPESTTTVDVSIPTVGVFTDVALER